MCDALTRARRAPRLRMSELLLRRFLATALVTTGHGLEARWTPASDGGPARFSKRYRDAQGIDDSRWGGGDNNENSWMPAIFPETMEGWLFACAACVGIYLLWQQQQQQQQPQGNRTAAPPTQRDRDAQEAARRAFTAKYNQ